MHFLGLGHVRHLDAHQVEMHANFINFRVKGRSPFTKTPIGLLGPCYWWLDLSIYPIDLYF